MAADATAVVAQVEQIEATEQPVSFARCPGTVCGIDIDIINSGIDGAADLALVSPALMRDARPLTTLPYGLPPVAWASQDVRTEVEVRFVFSEPSVGSHALGKCQEVIGAVSHPSQWLYDAAAGRLGDALAPLPTTTTIGIGRDATTGVETGWFETPLAGSGAASNNSTSLLRAPGPMAEFHRGSTAAYPFRPGGLDEDVIRRVEADVDGTADRSGRGALSYVDADSSSLLDTPPGFGGPVRLRRRVNEARDMPLKSGEGVSRKNILRLGDILADVGTCLGQAEGIVITEDEVEAASREREDRTQMEQRARITTHATHSQTSTDALSARGDTLDTVLDVTKSAPLLPSESKPSTAAPDGSWAVLVDLNADVSDFHEQIPEMAYKWPFELDPFQKQAVLLLERHECVFVAAHTSAGKTVVAEYAIALSAKHMTRTIYTSPIKALSNQKFRDFKRTFGDVGLITGDVQIQTDASCLIVTTEVLRSMLYRGADVIRDVEWVIFDEVHYVNDSERGVVWEEVIIMLPDHVGLILLSATVPNTVEFADWVGRTKKRKIHVISTLKRPVPLEHHLYTGNSQKTQNELFKVVDSSGNFLQNGYKAAVDALADRKKKEKDKYGPKSGSGSGAGGRATDKAIYLNAVDFLKKKELLPVVVFTFSKRRCEENADSLSNVELTSSSEKSEIRVFIESCVARLKDTDKQLPQVLRMREMLSRGIGVHHGGLLPIIKEMVELLFQRGLVRVLFATETFAMGVNMPTRTVIFDSVRKHDGNQFRELLAGEYTQMAGRAGRRGLDPTGTVIILVKGDEAHEASLLHTMLLGKPTKLESKFRISYNMMLNLLRVQEVKVEDMLRRSFFESATQRDVPLHKQLIKESESKLAEISAVADECPYCQADLASYCETAAEAMRAGSAMVQDLAASVQSTKALGAGRVIVVNSTRYRNVPAVVLRPPSSSSTAAAAAQRTSKPVLVMALCERKEMPVVPPRGHVPTVSSKCDPPRDPVPPTVLWRAHGPVGYAVVSVDASEVLFISKLRLKAESVDSERPDAASLEILLQQLLRTVEHGMASLEPIHPARDLNIREMSIVENYEMRESLIDVLGTHECASCPQLAEHYARVAARQYLSDEVRRLRMALSDHSLQMLPEYRQRTAVLESLKYVDRNAGAIQLKGQVACELATCDDAKALIATEMIFHGALAHLEPQEVVAVLSALIFQEKSDSEPALTERLAAARDNMVAIGADIASTQVQCGMSTPPDDFVRTQFKFGMMEVCYEWALGMPFCQITELTDVQEGSIVRCITRLSETCRDVRNAARVIGDPVLYEKMERAQAMIRRDIVFAASLYTT
eukprot:Opistho-2@13784